MSGRTTTNHLTRRTILRGLGAAGLGALTGAVAHGYMYERHHIQVTREDLAVAGWPEALNGLRVGFLSDLHRSGTVSHQMIAPAGADLMAEAPDLIILGGDYVTN